jgi:ParB/RepB/Spo0J family partition protein
MKPQKSNQADTSLFRSKKNISNLVYLKFDISKIEIDIDSSIRHEYDQDKLQELAESIRANNNELLQPIIIAKTNQSDNYKVVAGRRRFLACRDILKLEKISAVVKEFSDFNAEFSAQFAENEERLNWSDYDYVKAIQILKEKNPGISQAQIATIFNKSIDWTKKKFQHLGAIEDLPESALSHLNKIPTSHIIELKNYPLEDKVKLIENIATSNELPTVKEIRNEATIKTKKPKQGEITVCILTYDSKKEEFIENRDFVTKGVYDELKKLSSDDIAEIIKESKIKLEQVHSVYKYRSGYQVSFEEDLLLYENKNHALVKNGKIEQFKIFYFFDKMDDENTFTLESLSAKFPCLENLRMFDLKKGDDFHDIRMSTNWKIFRDSIDISFDDYLVDVYKIIGSNEKLYYHNKSLDRMATPNEHGFRFNSHDVCLNAKRIFSHNIGKSGEFLIAEAQDKNSFYMQCEYNSYSRKKNVTAHKSNETDRKARILDCVTREAKRNGYRELPTNELKKLHVTLFEFLRKEIPEFQNYSDEIILFYLEKYETGLTLQKFETAIKTEVARIRNDIAAREKAILVFQNFQTTQRIGSESVQLYEAWKKTGKVSDDDKKKVLSFLKDRKEVTQKELNTSRKQYQSIEKDHIDIANDILLLEDELLFETGAKVKKKAGNK